VKAPRVKRTRADLLAELRDQIHLLVHACRSFDGGLEPIGKHIALSLRVLLHHHGQSQALLQVVKDNKGRFFNRRELVLNIADTDGGAHVDPGLDAAYADLSRNNSLGWNIVEGDVQRPFPPPTMACIRQIAHEVLKTLQRKAGDHVAFDYAV
jgi:hypothetical protein